MSRAFARDRARPEPSRQLRRSARRLLAAARSTIASATALVPWLVSYAVGALLGVALLALLPEALDAARAAGGLRHPARRHPGLLRAREAGAAAPLPHRRMPGPRRHRAAGDHRRRLSQFHRRRDHLHGGADVGAARHQHRDRRRGARDSAGGRRRRRFCSRAGYSRATRAAAERRVRRVGHPAARSSRSAPSR